MSPDNLQKKQISEVIITILNGPQSGVAYKLVGQKLTIGRSPDSHIVLQDNKSSRLHAIMEMRNGQYWITDQGSQNGIVINGTVVRESILKSGDQITVGETMIRFGPPMPLSLINTTPAHAPTKSASLNLRNSFLPKSFPTIGKKNPLVFAAFVGFVIVVIILTMKTQSTKSTYQIKDEAAMQTRIDNLNQTNEQRQKEIASAGKDSEQYAEAQAFYLRGFRDFRENNFSRAIQNFETALSLFPNHPLAKRYLERSRLKLNETITQALERGEKDFELQKYNNAFNEYRTVLLLINDPNNKSFQLAKERIESIRLIIESNK